MKKTFIKSLSLLLAVLMLMTAVPLGVFATGEETTANCTHWDYLTTKGAKAASKDGHGNLAYAHCSNCGKYFQMTSSGPNFSKEYTQEETVIHFFPANTDYPKNDPAFLDPDHQKSDATCKNGNVFYKKCKFCNVFSTTETFEDSVRTPHTWGDAYAPAGSNCTVAGFKIYHKCDVCNKTEEIGSVTKQESHAIEARGKIEPTCLKVGHELGNYCLNCLRYIEGGAEISKKPHNIIEKAPAIPATCTTDGWTAAKGCETCLTKEEKAVKVPALQHKGGIVDVKKRPVTCFEDGYKMDATICKFCGHVYAPAGKSTEDVIIKAPGKHDYTGPYDPKAATQTEKGVKTRHWECSQFCTQTEGETEYFIRPTKKQKLDDGSEIERWITVWDEEAKNYTLNDGTYVYQQVTEAEVMIPAINHEHQWKYTKNQPRSCFTDGEIIGYCMTCGEKINKKEPQIGHHDWEWIRDKEPTCKEDGKMHQHCKVCGENGDSADIPKGQHKWIRDAAGDCTQGILGEFKCELCGAKETQKTDKKDSHVDADSDGKCDVCAFVLCKCICHNQTWYGKILYFFVKIWWQYFGIKEYCDCGVRHYDKNAGSVVPSVT